MKTTPLLMGVLILLLASPLSAQRYIVQVAAFSEPVDIDFYFGSKGVKGVQLSVNHNLIYKYNLGPYPDQDFAERVAQRTRDAGFPNARVIDYQAIQDQCALACAPLDDFPDPALRDDFDEQFTNIVIDENFYIRNLFFDFNRSHLTDASLQQLDALYDLLVQHPDYKAELHGHTDWVGSDDFNEQLARRRAYKARNYLVERGIQRQRLIPIAFGEHNPIARNATPDGRDNEEGRRLNRRVEVRIIDANGEILWDVVEAIKIPDYLKVND